MAWLTTGIRNCGLGCLRTRHDSSLNCKHTKLHKHAGLDTAQQQGATAKSLGASGSGRGMHAADKASQSSGFWCSRYDRYRGLDVLSRVGKECGEILQESHRCKKARQVMHCKNRKWHLRTRDFFPENCTAQAG